MADGGFIRALFAQGGAQGDMQFGARIAGERRFQQRDRRVELAIGAQKIGQVDQRLQPARLDAQHLAIELLRGIRQTQDLGGIAQGEQDAAVARLGGQGLFILDDGLHMPSL